MKWFLLWFNHSKIKTRGKLKKIDIRIYLRELFESTCIDTRAAVLILRFSIDVAQNPVDFTKGSEYH